MWRHGPMPPDTWNWGGVILSGQDPRGFHFADFCGDYVRLVPDGRIVKPEEIGYYNNSIHLPFHLKSVAGRICSG